MYISFFPITAKLYVGKSIGVSDVFFCVEIFILLTSTSQTCETGYDSQVSNDFDTDGWTRRTELMYVIVSLTDDIQSEMWITSNKV